MDVKRQKLHLKLVQDKMMIRKKHPAIHIKKILNIVQSEI